MENSHEIRMRSLKIELKRISQGIDHLFQAYGISPDAPEKPSLKKIRAISAKSATKKGRVRELKK